MTKANGRSFNRNLNGRADGQLMLRLVIKRLKKYNVKLLDIELNYLAVAAIVNVRHPGTALEIVCYGSWRLFCSTPIGMMNMTAFPSAAAGVIVAHSVKVSPERNCKRYV